MTGLVFMTKGDLSDPKFKRVRRITAGIDIKKNMMNKYYFSIFMVRRSIYAMIPIVFYQY